MSVEAYPLQWPEGWPRTEPYRKKDSKYQFRKKRWNNADPFWTFAEARDVLMQELDKLGAVNAVLSSNYETRLDGLPRSGQRRPNDTGIAVYFTLDGKQMVMACDMHVRAEENMRSIALAIEAMRQLERHGGGVMMERAFQGFAQIEAPKSWRQVLGVSAAATLQDCKAAFREKAKTAHPDAGGSEAAFAELSAAWAKAQEELA